MRLISHRGNLNGPNPERENRKDYIKEALELEYDVEVDIWYIDDKLYLGHDEPQEELTLRGFWEGNHSIWYHCKNTEALDYCTRMGSMRIPNYFWHQDDDYTLTSKGIVWVYPNKQLTFNSICVMPELNNQELRPDLYGVCSDYIENYRNDITNLRN